MRCARHPYEGGVGVCAPCLRDRLLALAAAQNEASSLPLSPPPPPPTEPGLPELVLPRSVSPYVCRRKSDASPAESPWLPTPSPMRKTPCRRRLGGAGAGVSGFAVCISPLVRPSLGRHLRGGGHPPDAAVSGELRPSPLHPLTSSASLHHCRSWKLADGGRFR